MKACLIAILFMTAAALGQEGTSSAPPDFSAAFKQLATLGMPPLGAGAKWSKLPDEMTSDYTDYEFHQMLRSLKGNGWVIESPDGTSQMLAAAQTAPATQEGETNQPSGQAKPRKTTEVDLAKDLEGIRKYLAKKKAENSRYSGVYEITVGGKLLLLATQFHQGGKTGLANELAAAVFETWPNREAVVDAAVTSIANKEFENISEAFFSSGDWAAYHNSLIALQKKFPRGWPTGQALNLLLPQLSKQVAGEKPPTPALPGVELDPRALDAAAKLTVKPEPDSAEKNDEALLKSAGIKMSDIPAGRRAMILRSLRMQGVDGGGQLNVSPYWLLQDRDESDGGNSPVSPLVALGMDALPVLAALLDDPYLTPFPHPNERGYSSYFSSSEGEAERIERAYQSMRRPASRGDIAAMMLELSIPRGERDGNEVDSESLKEQVLEFWKKHRKSSREELASAYLQEGDNAQQSQAAEILTKSTDPRYIKVFEDHVLTAENAISNYQLVKNYLGTRKAAAKPFYEAYAKVVREQAKDANSEENQIPWEAREAGGVEKILKSLESFVGGKSYRAIAKDISNGDPEEADAAIRSLLELMREEPYTKKLYALLEGAVTAEKPEIRQEFVNKVWHINNAVEELDGEEAAAAEETKPAMRKLPEAEVKAWRKLMADKRSVKGESPGSDPQKESTIGDQAAIAVCYSANPGHYSRIYQSFPITKRKQTEVFLEHAEAILSGRETPELPDAARVKPERLRAIVDTAGAKAPLEIHPYLETLTHDERAAWIQWMAEPGDIEVPKPVKDLATMIFRRSEDRGFPYPAVTETAPIDAGFILTAESIKTAIETLAKDTQKLSLTTIWIKSAEIGPGMETVAVRFPMPEKKPADSEEVPISITGFAKAVSALEERESAEGCVVFAIGSRGRGDMFEIPWIVEKGKATQSEDRVTSTQMDEVVTRILTNEHSGGIYFSIQVLSKADADKIRAMTPETEGHEGIEGLPFLPQPIE